MNVFTLLTKLPLPYAHTTYRPQDAARGIGLLLWHTSTRNGSFTVGQLVRGTDIIAHFTTDSEFEILTFDINRDAAYRDIEGIIHLATVIAAETTK